jgi:hypothetical protein
MLLSLYKKFIIKIHMAITTLLYQLKHNLSILKLALRKRLTIWKKLYKESQLTQEEFLLSFFREEIAYKEELTKAWEFNILRKKYFFTPPKTTENVTKLARDFEQVQSSPCFIEFTQEEQEIPDTINNKEKRIRDQSIINYHSVKIFYSQIREKGKIKPSLNNILLTTMLLAFIPIYFILDVTESLRNYIEGEDPSLAYKIVESSNYYLQIKNNSNLGTNYRIFFNTFPENELEEAIFDPIIETKSISYGKQYFGTDLSDKVRYFKIQAQLGDTFLVYPYPWHTGSDHKISVLNQDMQVCDEVFIGKSNMEIMKPFLSCQSDAKGPYYLKITAEDKVDSLSDYGFSLYRSVVLSPVAKRMEESQILNVGDTTLDNLGPSEERWYKIEGKATQEMIIRTEKSASNAELSLSLYRPNDSSTYELLAYTTHSIKYLGFWWNDIRIITDQGKTYFISYYLSKYGIPLNYKNFSLISIEFYFFGILTIGLLFLLFFFVDWIISYRRKFSGDPYYESLIIRYILDILLALTDDHVLNNGDKRTEIQNLIKKLINHTYRTPKKNILPFINILNPLNHELGRISMQFLEMNSIVAVPGKKTLNILRKNFYCWFVTLLKSRYADFQFTESFNKRPIRWYEKYLFLVANNWKQYIKENAFFFIVIGVSIMVGLQHSPYYTLLVLGKAWLVFRIILLLMIVNIIYYRWGVKEIIYDTEKESKIEIVGRLFLYVFLPFIVADIILQTGVINYILQLITTNRAF